MSDEMWLRQKSCRCCGTTVSAENLADKDTLGGTCLTCGHFNVLRQDSVRLPIGKSLESLRGVSPVPALPANSGDHDESFRALGLAFRCLLDGSRAVVRRDRPAATAFLLDAIARREDLLAETFTRKAGAGADGNGGYEDKVSFDAVVANKGTQMLYLLLAESGPLDLRDSASNPDRSHLHTTLWPLLTDACGAAQMLSNADAGLSRLELSRGDVVAHKTAAHTLYQEQQLNLYKAEARFKQAADPLDEPEYYAAQEALLGFSTRDLIKLWAGRFDQLKTLTQVVERGGISFIVLDGLPPPFSAMLEAMMLTPERVRRFGAAFYFDLGPERDPQQDALTVDVDACLQNWTAYYPLYAAVAVNGRTRLAITSARAVQGALVNMYTVRSNMLAQLIEASKRDEFAAARAAVRKLAAQSWARIEAGLAETARAQGWAALSGLQTIGGKALPCGEVDVLLARRAGDALTFMLVEAKDVDLPFWKPGSMDRLTKTVARAARQIEQKREWLAANWRAAGDHLGLAPGRRAVITAMVVTRRYVIAGLVPGCSVVPQAAFSECLAHIARGETGPRDGLAGFQVREVS